MMRTRTICVVPAAFLLAAASMPAVHAKVYTFDYAVYADSDDAKPLVIFNTGKAAYFELPDGVVVKDIIVRKNKAERPSAFYRNGSYVVVPEPHDSLSVTTDRGEFTAEYVGPRVARSRLKASSGEASSPSGKTNAQKPVVAHPGVAQDSILPEKQERIKVDAGKSEQKNQFKEESLETVGEQQEPRNLDQARPKYVPQHGDPQSGQEKLVINIPSGTALSSAVAEFASSNDYAITWQARERYATLNLRLEGSFESIIDNIARTFGLTAYLAGKTIVFVDEK